MRTFVAALAALSLGATPALAAPQAPANGARSLSITKAARTTAPAARRNALAAPGGAITIVLIAAAVVGGIVLITNTERDDPDSN